MQVQESLGMTVRCIYEIAASELFSGVARDLRAQNRLHNESYKQMLHLSKLARYFRRPSVNLVLPI